MSAAAETWALYGSHPKLRPAFDAVWEDADRMRGEPTPPAEMLDRFERLVDGLARHTPGVLLKATQWAKENGRSDAETILDYAERLDGRY